MLIKYATVDGVGKDFWGVLLNVVGYFLLISSMCSVFISKASVALSNKGFLVSCAAF